MIYAVDKWLPGYLISVLRHPRTSVKPQHLIFCIADHFEPFGYKTARADTLERVRVWVRQYPKSFDRFRDADGCPPRHTLFCSQEEYDPEYLELLVPFCGSLFGEVEIHLHHRDDTAEGLREKLTSFRDNLHERHGMLGAGPDGNVRYGFVHGNWALCNSRPDGDWCGVNEELSVLAETGCYADFTFPSAPSPTQPRTVNALYRAWDRAGRPRGHDYGVPVRVPAPHRAEGSGAGSRVEDAGRRTSSLDVGRWMLSVGRSISPRRRQDAACPPISHSPLMLIQGPLCLDWRRRKWGILPRLENADISRARPPSPDRIDLWVKQHIHVLGQPEWVFVKVHTHGTVPRNMEAALGESMQRIHEYMREKYNDGKQWRLHYVAAREMYNVIRAAEDGMTGDPGQYRDYEISPPPVSVGPMPH